ncbi:MAG TPA: hypothetical protein PLH43_01700 [Acetivibrio sp.]|uniref:hypothetical protein n=1 Tax=Acetivibrio sp. TaxID=1872092 RepID=UPI002C3AA510|nr:hypothetical protein [Acetivibrio sp.]HOM01528.1 hypothetical protein [Acetivibrio sp.]
MKNVFKWSLNKLVIIGASLYIMLIIVFMLNSGVVRLSQNPLTNKALDVLFVVLAGAFGYGVLRLMKKALNLHILRKEYIRVLLIVLVTLVTRFVWINIVDITPKSDFELYNNLAEAFSRGEAAGGKYVALFPHTFGYPFVLAMVYGVFSPDKYFALILNILFEVGTGVLIYYLGKMVSNWEIGFSAAVIWALWPSHVFYSSIVCTEPLYTLLMVLLIFAYFKFSAKNSNFLYSCVLYLVLGFLCAAANAVRPMGTLLIIVMGIAEVVRIIKRREGLKQSFAGLAPFAAFLIAYFSLVNLAGVYVSHKVGYRTAKNPIGFNTYVGTNISSSGTWNQNDANDLLDLMKQEPFDAQEVHERLLDMTIQRVKSQGIGNLKLVIKKNMIMWERDDEVVTYMIAGSNEEASSLLDIKGREGLLRYICNFYYYMIVILAFKGLLGQFKREDDNILLVLLLLFIGIGAIHTIVEVHGRYHYSAMVVFSILAGANYFKIES